MSQPDLIAELRGVRPAPPEALRQRVRLLAGEAAVPPRRFTWRRAALVLVPTVAALVAAAALLPRGDTPQQEAARESLEMTRSVHTGVIRDMNKGAELVQVPEPPASPSLTYGLSPRVPAPNTNRAQLYSATLELRVPNANAISRTTQRALSITSSLGGHPQTVNVDTRAKRGTAYLVLSVPRRHIEEAVRRLGDLGTIVAADVSIKDVQPQVDAGERQIEKLQQQLADLRAQPETEELTARIDALVSQIQRLQRSRTSTLRAAQFATVDLRLTTPAPAAAKPDDDSPLDGLGTVFRWGGIGAVYAIALGAPLLALAAVVWLLARVLRRRREEQLLALS
jgi:hypothetical protein